MSCSPSTSLRAPLRRCGSGHLQHQGLLMGALDQGQDSVQLLSGHVVWNSQGMVSTQVPTEGGQQQTDKLPSLKPALSLESGRGSRASSGPRIGVKSPLRIF